MPRSGSQRDAYGRVNATIGIEQRSCQVGRDRSTEPGRMRASSWSVVADGSSGLNPSVIPTRDRMLVQSYCTVPKMR